MLHCPASRVHLTSSDISDFEQRLVAKQSERYVSTKTPGIRLGFAAGNLTRSSIVPSHRNFGRQRADSCNSRAQFCSEEEEIPPSPSIIPTIVTLQASPGGNVDHIRTTSSPRHLRAIPYGDQRQIHSSSPLRHQTESASRSRAIPGPRSIPSPSLPHIPDRVTSLSDGRRAAFEAARKPSRPSSIPRPRRPSPRSAPFSIYEQPSRLNEYHERLHLSRSGPRSWTGQSLPPLSSERGSLRTSQSQVTPLLDPSASVFVPRTRFGSINSTSGAGTTGSAADYRFDESVESSENFAHSRTQSILQVDAHRAHLEQEAPAIGRNVSVHGPQDTSMQARRRSRTHEYDTTGSQSTSNTERRTSTRQPSASFAARRGSGSQRPVIFPRRESSRRNLVAFQRARQATSTTTRVSSGSVASVSLLNVPRDIDNGRQMPRSVSPALSTSSRSTPNLLRPPPIAVSEAHTRRSSFTSEPPVDPRAATFEEFHKLSLQDQRDDDGPSADIHIPTAMPGSALDHFLNNRDSPLDELGDRLSRMSSNRPRSVGRSFHQPPGSRPRISLLSGDPFREDTPPEPPPLSSDEYDGYQTFFPQEQSQTSGDRREKKKKHDSVVSDDDPVALSLALPSPAIPPLSPSPLVSRSSPTPSQQPSTPATALRDRAKTPRTSASISSPVRGSEWISSGTPPMPPSATPARMTIYNDARPAELQPQTPADLSRSAARRRARAGTHSSHRSGVSNISAGGFTGSPATSASGIVERSSNPNRHSYPAAATPITASPVAIEVVETPARVPVVVGHEGRSGGRVTRRSWVASIEDEYVGYDDEDGENDVENGLVGLEEDRRVRIERHEGNGTLDITPPAEGRWERYLE